MPGNPDRFSDVHARGADAVEDNSLDQEQLETAATAAGEVNTGTPAEQGASVTTSEAGGETQPSQSDPTATGAASSGPAATGAAAQQGAGSLTGQLTALTTRQIPLAKVGSKPLGAGHQVTSMATNKPTVNLSQYSGNPVGTALTGGGTEEFTAESWIRRVEIIANSTGWNSNQKAGHAALALAPNTPAERWYTYKSEGGALDEWEDFKKALLREFSPPETIMSKVAMFKSMKLGKAEKASDFLNKLHLKFAKFEDGLDPMWQTAAYLDEATSPALKARREMVVKDVIKHLKMVMFAAGLPDPLVAEITKAKAETLETMLETCRLAEAAAAATSQKPKTMGAMGATEDKAAGEKLTTKEEVAQMVAAILKAESKGGQAGEKKQLRDFSKAVCYYCEKKGHISPHCPVKKEERAKNIFRVTTKDPRKTKEQWDALPKEQRSWRGRQQQSTSATLQATGPPGPPVQDWWQQFYPGN